MNPRMGAIHLDSLPSAQRALWDALSPAAGLGFVLYGGTAVALRLGHRVSVDFDFFTEGSLDHSAIFAAFSFMDQATVLQEETRQLTILAQMQQEKVKVSFFGAIGFGRVGDPEWSPDGLVQVASFDDLMACKLKVILQRAEAKDYQDIAAMLRAGVSLSNGLAAARALFGPSFQPGESLKALCYFSDGDLHRLTDADRILLSQSASAVRELPDISLISHCLTL